MQKQKKGLFRDKRPILHRQTVWFAKTQRKQGRASDGRYFYAQLVVSSRKLSRKFHLTARSVAGKDFLSVEPDRHGTRNAQLCRNGPRSVERRKVALGSKRQIGFLSRNGIQNSSDSSLTVERGGRKRLQQTFFRFCTAVPNRRKQNAPVMSFRSWEKNTLNVVYCSRPQTPLSKTFYIAFLGFPLFLSCFFSSVSASMSA